MRAVTWVCRHCSRCSFDFDHVRRQVAHGGLNSDGWLLCGRGRVCCEFFRRVRAGLGRGTCTRAPACTCASVAFSCSAPFLVRSLCLPVAVSPWSVLSTHSFPLFVSHTHWPPPSPLVFAFRLPLFCLAVRCLSLPAVCGAFSPPLWAWLFPRCLCTCVSACLFSA